MKNTAINKKTKTVTIISLWSRRLRGPESQHQYDVSVRVAPTMAEILEAAFEMTNLDNRPLVGVVAATTTGDLMLSEGKYYWVAPQGFRLISSEEAAREIAWADAVDWKTWSTRAMMETQPPGVKLGPTMN